MQIFIAILFCILVVAVFSNLQRRKRKLQYELTPNCLLTRWPVLFISGQRSLFYFSQYWNIFPEFLTEHGYEVYSLNLPWSGPERLIKMQDFLEKHSREERRYHLIIDRPTRREFTELWSLNYPCVMSLTEVKDNMLSKSPLGMWNRLSYTFHQMKVSPSLAPSPHALGVSSKASLQNAQLLLQQVSTLAEEDVLGL